MKLSDRAQKIKPSPTLAIAAMARSMKEKGIEVIDLSAGEPDFPTPEKIQRAAIDAIKKGFSKYTAVAGIPKLRETISDRLLKDYGVKFDPGQIIVSNGAKHSIFNVLQALVNEGDEVLIPTPYWVSYPDMVVIAKGVPVLVRTKQEDSFKMKKEHLLATINPKTKAIILNSPSNPTGSVYTVEELQNIVDILKEKDIAIITDDIYQKIVFEGQKAASIVDASGCPMDRTFIINGLSKAYAMTGWRIGYAAGPKEFIAAMGNIQGQTTSNINTPAQYAAIEALSGEQDSVESMRWAFEERRNYICERLSRIADIVLTKPMGAFYAFPNMSAYYNKACGDKKVTDSQSMTEYILGEAKVAVVPGKEFGEDNCIRISFATSMENIKKGMDRIERALQRLV